MPARPHFVVSTGRSGSTLLSEILASHPDILSLSECLVNFRPDAFPDGVLSAAEFGEHVARPRARLSLLLRHRLEPPEVLYPVDSGRRFNRDTGVPPLSVACLPALFDDPDAALDDIQHQIATFPPDTAARHYQRLFDSMTERMGRRVWTERSGGSLVEIGSLIANFPSARYIHLYRDGPTCATSMSRHTSFRLQLLATMLGRQLGYDPYDRPDPTAAEHVDAAFRPLLPSQFDPDAFRSLELPVERFGRMWSAIVLSGTRRLARVDPDDVLHLSYEALVAEPAVQIQRVLGFVGVAAPDAAWLEQAAAQISPLPEPSEPPSVALARACESGMRRLREITGSSDAEIDGYDPRGSVPRTARRRAEAGLPPGPEEGLATLVGRFFTDPESLFLDAHERFGDCFSIVLPGVRSRPRPSVVIADPAAITELLTSGPVLSTVVPSRFVMETTLGPESTFMLDGDAHLRRRRTVSASFHGEALAEWARIASGIAEREVASWSFDEPVELGPRLYDTVLDVIFEVVLGSVDPARRAGLRELVSAISTQDNMNALGWQRRSAGAVPPRGALDEVLTAELEARRDRASGGHADVLSVLLDTTDEHGRALSDEMVRDEIVTLLVAGHETTAGGLAWTFELLMRNPEALAQAGRDAVAGSGRYLAAVVKEALRHKPPISFVNRTLRRPWDVSGFTLPVGTDVAASIFLVHRRPDLYPDPDAFRPERFLDGPPPRFTWVPFGAGSRRCLGAGFAELEMRAVLRAVLARATPELAEPAPLPSGTWHGPVLFPSGGTRAVLRSVTSSSSCASASGGRS
jgi:cytochrome P450 family 135